MSERGRHQVQLSEHVAIYDACKAGNYELAAKIQAKMNRLIAHISGPNNMSRYKICLKHRGVIADAAVRKPLRGITPAEAKKLIATIEKMDYLDPTKL